MSIFNPFKNKKKRNHDSSIFESLQYRAFKKQNSNDSQFSTDLSIKTNINKKVGNNTNVQLLTPESSPIKNNNVLEKKFSELNIIHNNKPQLQSHSIFEIPEILDRIIYFVKIQDELDFKKCTLNNSNRKKPQTYKHYLLLYKNEEIAKKVWEKVQSEPVQTNKRVYSLYNCLTVNKLWNQISFGKFFEQLNFENEVMFSKFLYSLKSEIKPKSLCIKNVRMSDNYTQLLLNTNLNLSELTTLEIKLCPNFLPPVEWFQYITNLKSLSFPGNNKVNDRYLMQIISYGNLKTLKNLDLRACENITDAGVTYVATNCPNLVSCNLGRFQSAENITSVSVAALANHTRIETLGLTGCNVNDVAIWELATTCGKNIKRLALNNCQLLTNLSLKIIANYSYFPNLSVLEIRNVSGFTELKNLVVYKNWKRSMKMPFLLESCEKITELICREETKLIRTNSLTVIRDMTEWVNDRREDKS